MRQSKPFSGNSIDMVTGPLLKNLLLFSLPLMATNILQLLFNAADVVVVGVMQATQALRPWAAPPPS